MAGPDSRGRGDDNHGEASARLYGVTEPDVWEGEIRRTLADQAARVRPSGVDFAAVALSRARRVRRRRRALGLAGTLGAVVTATGLVMSNGLPGGASDAPSYTTLFGDPLPATIAPTPAIEDGIAAEVALAADLSVGLVTVDEAEQSAVVGPDGAVLKLGPVGKVASAYRVDEGWAVAGGDPGALDLWWVAPGSEPVVLLPDLDAIALGPGRVAWRQGATLSAAVLTGAGELTGRADTWLPEGDVEPAGFLGDAVLLSRDGGEGWDVWQPAGGDYRPNPNTEVARVFGAAPGGEVAIGLAAPRPGDSGPCLARLRVVSGLEVAARTCPAKLPDLSAASLAPDGRWLVAVAAAPLGTLDPAAASSVVVVDVPAAFGEWAAPAGAGRVDPVAVIPLAGTVAEVAPVWPTADEAVLATADSLVWVAPRGALAGEPEAVYELPFGRTPPLPVPAAE